MVKSFGEYGGIVHRKFKGPKKPYIIGAVLTAKEVMEWPLSNRAALSNSGIVSWYQRPADVTLNELQNQTVAPIDDGQQSLFDEGNDEASEKTVDDEQTEEMDDASKEEIDETPEPVVEKPKKRRNRTPAKSKPK